MSFMNSWCERLFVCSLIVLISIVLADYKFYFLPINGVWLLFYVLCVIVSTIWFTCINIQKLLQCSVPFDYNLDFTSYETLQNIYRFIYANLFAKDNNLSHLKNESNTPELAPRHFLDSQPFKDPHPLKIQLPIEKSIDERIELLVNDIEEKFISKWYSVISTEDSFQKDSKILLEGIIRRILQVSVQIDSSKLMCGGLVILLKHLKEYRKSIKRVQKTGGSIESVYRYSHIGNKNEAALEHFTHKLTANVLREFISWELWNSLPCRLLVSVLSKKLTTYLLFFVSQPGWLNMKILYQASSKSDILDLKLDKYFYISLSDVDLSNGAIKNENKADNVETILQTKSCTPQLSPKKDVNENGNASEAIIHQAITKIRTPTIIQEKLPSSSPSPEESLFKPKRSEPVKIHSAKSISKTWDESELANVSLGQDLLALEALEGTTLEGFSGRRRRLWGYNADVPPVEDSSETMDEWNSDVKEATETLKHKRKEIVVTHSLRPIISTSTSTSSSSASASAFVTNTIRPIAGNVTNTLHNMREFQQSTVHATEKAMHKIGDLQDEAVGVVEGIFDFGMAGLRKGLRLTGLQEPKLKTQLNKTKEEESVWINPITQDSPNGFENQMLLEKSPNIVTESEVEEFFTESPEYEETADLASTISKLRSLLQQKSSESSFNTPAVSPSPLLIDLEDEKITITPTESDKGDGGMQRFARTVTGMFNTFKTALPGNVAEQQTNKGEWIFVENETSETDLLSLLNSLLIERRDYCTVDTAYEAMDSLDLLTESVNSQTSKIPWENHTSTTYEDELDDLDTSIPITKALFDIICECLQDTKCALNQEPLMKALYILVGANSEKNLIQQADKFIRIINKIIGPLPNNTDDNVMALNVEQMIDLVQKSFPYYIQQLFGNDNIKSGIKFLIASLQSPKINQDIMLQIFELVCSQLIFASSQMSPTPSA